MGNVLQLGGQWDIVQDNGFTVSLNVTQNQESLSASASHSDGSVQSTSAPGSVRGPNFEMTITWDNNTEGQYKGTFKHGPSTGLTEGFLEGHAIDLKNPTSTTGWHSNGRDFRFA